MLSLWMTCKTNVMRMSVWLYALIKLCRCVEYATEQTNKAVVLYYLADKLFQLFTLLLLTGTHFTVQPIFASHHVAGSFLVDISRNCVRSSH